MPTPVGNEFNLNTTTAQQQTLPNVTELAAGGFFAVWTSSISNVDSIRGQFLDASGAKVGGEIVVASADADSGTAPAVTALSNGNILVSWLDVSNTLSDNQGVAGQIIDGTTRALSGSRFQINGTLTDVQSQPTVAALASGGFVAAWSDRANNTDISARVFNSSLIGGTQFAVNTTTTGVQVDPDVAVLSNGGFAITWTDSGTNGANNKVRMRVYDSAGANIGNDIVVNSGSGSRGVDGDIAALSDGRFIVSWYDEVGGNVKARIFNNDGSTIGGLNEFSVGSGQFRPSVAPTTNGGFIISYEQNDDIKVQEYAANGTTIGTVVSVNTTTTGIQRDSAIAVGGDSGIGARSRAIILWSDFSRANTNPVDEGEVQGRVLSLVADTTAPTYASATVNGATLVLNYNEALDATNLPLANAFTVQVGGGSSAVSTVAVSGQAVTLTLATPVTNAQFVTVSYTDPTGGNDPNAVQDLAGNDAVSLVAAAVTNNTAAPTPTPSPTPDPGPAGPITGTSSPELIRGTSSPDTIFGGEGNDTLFGDEGGDIIYGNQDSDLSYGNQGTDTLYGGQGSDTCYGGQGSDVVYGNLGNDIAYGNLGDDALYGGQGNDLLFGGQGNDTLAGGVGNDILTGGLGADRYVVGTGSGADLILGFSQAEGDKLDFGGQTFVASDNGRGGTLFTLSGGGTVDVAGAPFGTLGPSAFA